MCIDYLVLDVYTWHIRQSMCKEYIIQYRVYIDAELMVSETKFIRNNKFYGTFFSSLTV